MTVDPQQPAVGFGDKLKSVHDDLRAWLESLRGEVSEFLSEHGAAASGSAAPSLAYELRKNCLDFCFQLDGHHETEDGRFFPALEREFPELAPQIAKMREEHVVVAQLVQGIREVVSDMGSGDPAQTLTELDRIAESLKAHLDYEERYIITAMNELPPSS